MFNPITVNNYASLFNCTPVGRASDYDGPDLKLFILVGWGWSGIVCCLAHRGSTGDSLWLQIFSDVVQGSQVTRQHVGSVESSSMVLFMICLFYREDSLTSLSFTMRTELNVLNHFRS